MTSPPTRIPCGFAIPQVFPDGPVELDTIRSIATRAEELGFESLWTQEQIVGRSRSLEPLTLLSHLAAVTEWVRLGVSVIVLPYRSPVQLAKAVGSLDQLSGGRAILGVGLGARGNEPVFGISERRRIRRLIESVQVMDALWTQDEAVFDGCFFKLDGTPMEPKPLQRPRPPIWFGARTEKALRRAVRYGDGWMGPGSSSSADFREHVQIVRRALDESGRDPSTFTISKRVYIAIDEDAERAERRLKAWFAHHYRNADMASRVSTWGPAERCYDDIDALIQAGAQHLLLNPVFDYEVHLDKLAHYVR